MKDASHGGYRPQIRTIPCHSRSKLLSTIHNMYACAPPPGQGYRAIGSQKPLARHVGPRPCLALSAAIQHQEAPSALRVHRFSDTSMLVHSLAMHICPRTNSFVDAYHKLIIFWLFSLAWNTMQPTPMPFGVRYRAGNASIECSSHRR